MMWYVNILNLWSVKATLQEGNPAALAIILLINFLLLSLSIFSPFFLSFLFFFRFSFFLFLFFSYIFCYHTNCHPKKSHHHRHHHSPTYTPCLSLLQISIMVHIFLLSILCLLLLFFIIFIFNIILNDTDSSLMRNSCRGDMWGKYHTSGPCKHNFIVIIISTSP